VDARREAKVDAMISRRLSPASRLEQRIAMLSIAVPSVGVVVAGLLWRCAGVMHPSDLWLCAGMYAATSLGVTAGFHRGFAHRSFAATEASRIVLGILGSMAMQGPLFHWVAVHRRHHQHSDGPGDPHSPYAGAMQERATIVGLLHAHVGWMLEHEPPDFARHAPDLLRDRTAFWIHRHYPLWVLFGVGLPGVVGAVATHSWVGALTGALWGGLVRISLVHHATWSVNSICHAFGARDHATRDRSTNHFFCALLTFGEGWHNNHHAFPSSARHGLRWWQLDLTYAFIRLLEIVGAASAVKLPGREEIS
jgi:stearoyl-CoA desaturase (Delta-9 desaturase)